MVPLIITGLLVPIGVGALTVQYHATWKEEILKKCQSKLKTSPGYPAPQATVDYFDVSVSGVVASFEERNLVKLDMNSVAGMSCDDDDLTELRVLPSLAATREGNLLRLKGSLASAAALENVERVIRRAEPGISLEASEVMVSPIVMATDTPGNISEAAASPLLKLVWPRVHVAYPEISGDYSGKKVRFEGKFPDGVSRERVLEALRNARPGIAFDDSGLVVDTKLPPVEFSAPVDSNSRVPDWLAPAWDRWIHHPALSVTVDRGVVKITGSLPNAATLETVVGLLRRLRPGFVFDADSVLISEGSLESPLIVPAAIKNWEPPVWLAGACATVASAPSD